MVRAEARLQWVENLTQEKWRVSIDNSFNKSGCEWEVHSFVVVGYLLMYVYQERQEHSCMLYGKGEVKDVEKKRIYDRAGVPW